MEVEIRLKVCNNLSVETISPENGWRWSGGGDASRGRGKGDELAKVLFLDISPPPVVRRNYWYEAVLL